MKNIKDSRVFYFYAHSLCLTPGLITTPDIIMSGVVIGLGIKQTMSLKIKTRLSLILFTFPWPQEITMHWI